MKNARRCPKCGCADIIRVPDNAHRYLANSICIARHGWVRRIPVTRFVCGSCGFAEDWVETTEGLKEVRRAFG